MALSKQIISALVQKPSVTGLAAAFPLFFRSPPPLSLSPFLPSFPLSPKWQSWQIISFAIAWERGGRSVGGGPRSAIIRLSFPLLSSSPVLSPSPPQSPDNISEAAATKTPRICKRRGPLAISVHTQGSPLRPTFTVRDFFSSFRSQSCLHYTRFSYIAVKKGVGASVSLLPTQPNCEMLLPQESLPFIPSPPFTPCCSRCRKLTFFEFGIHPLSPGKTTKKPAF